MPDTVFLSGTGVQLGVGDNPERIPGDFDLIRIVPNPFNPETNIEFYLKEAGSVYLSVYDISGRLVDVLYEGVLQSGCHSLTFNGKNLSSGIYFCRLKTQSDVKSVKLLNMK